MEVSLIEERACERRESLLVSQSIPSPRELSSIDLVADDDKKEGETSEHFTIRGYVAGIRKTDAKICWPFFMLHNHKSDEYANLFPPLPVTEFRCWSCENCQRKTDAPAVAVPNEALFNSQNDEVKGINTSLLGSTIMASHSDEKILLPGVQQLSEEKILEGQLVEADSSINVSDGECRPSICPTKKKNESVIKDLTREGFQIPKTSPDSCEEIQNQPSDRPTSVATKGRACPGERTVVQTTNTLGIAHGEGAPTMLHAKSKGTELVHEITDSEMAAVPTFVGNDVAISGQKQHNDVTRHVHDIDSMGLDEYEHEASDYDMGLTEYTAQCNKHASKVLTSDGKLHRKKARKVRLLDDILRCEELDVMSKKFCISNGNAEAGQTEDNINRRPDACKGKDQHLDHKSQLADQKTKEEPNKSKARYIALENEDEGPSLMYWLKRVTKKAMTHKGDAEIKHTDSAVFNSKPAADASAGKGLDLTHKGSGIKGNKPKVFVHTKQTEMPWDSLIPQQDMMTAGKGLIVAVDAVTNKILAKTSDSELKGIIITGQTPHHSPKIQDSSHKKAIVSKKKRKAPQVKEGESSQMSKDSFGKLGHGNFTDFQGQKKVTKKRRTTRMREKEVLDDIPMDIVELLAKNQHERQLMDVKTATDTMHNWSEMPENMESNGLNATDGNGNMVLDAVHKDLSQRKTLSINMVNDLGSNRNAYHSPSNGKQSNHMDLSKRDVIGASTGLSALPQFRSQPMSSVLPPKSDSKDNYFAQSHSWNSVRMPTPESCHTYQAISGQNSGRNSHGRSSVLLNGTLFRINPQNADADSNHMNNLCHDSLLPRKMKTVPRETDNLKLVNQDGTHLPNSKVRAESSIHKRNFPGATSFAEVGNTLYPNEIIPAMHLLRLMDSATWSGAPLHKSLDINQIGFIQESDFYSNDQCYDLTGLKSRVKTSQAPKHQLTVEHPDQGQHYENSCQPLRPRPRIGVFGSLLQKEIATRSENCGTQFGLKTGHSNKLKSGETDGKGKSEWPRMATHTRILNDQTPISRNENIKQLSSNCGTQFGRKIRHSNELKSCETNGKEKSESSHTVGRTRVLNAQRPISTNENIKQLFSAVNSIAHPGCSLARDDMVQVNINSEAAAVQPLKMEICVVNRNPADFTILDEDNEYMITSEDLRPRHITPSENLKSPNHTDGQKRRKVMKLTASLGLVRN